MEEIGFVGLSGFSLSRYVNALGGQLQRIDVDPELPHRRLVQTFLELVASKKPHERNGMSVIVVDLTPMDEHGASGHTNRWEYHYDLASDSGWLELQDSGKQKFGPYTEPSAAGELEGLFAMAFGPRGESLLLPGAEVVPPPDRRIGHDEHPVPAADPAAATPLAELLAVTEPDDDLLLGRLKKLDGRYGRLDFRVIEAHYLIGNEPNATRSIRGLYFAGEISDSETGRAVWWPKFDIQFDELNRIVVRFRYDGTISRYYAAEVYNSFVARLDNEFFGPSADRMHFKPEFEVAGLVATQPGIRWDATAGQFELAVERLYEAAQNLFIDTTPVGRRRVADVLGWLERAGVAGSSPADVRNIADAADPQLGARLLAAANPNMVRHYGEYLAADPAARTAAPKTAPVAPDLGEPTETLTLRELLTHDEPRNALLRGVLPGNWVCGPYRVQPTVVRYIAEWRFGDPPEANVLTRHYASRIVAINVQGGIDDNEGNGVGFLEYDIMLDDEDNIAVTDLTYLDGVPDNGFHADLAARTEDYFRDNGVDRIVGTTLTEYGAAAMRSGASWPVDNPTDLLDVLRNFRSSARTLRRDSTKADQTILDDVLQRFAGRPADFPSPAELADLAGDNPYLGRDLVAESRCHIIRRLRPAGDVTGAAARSVVAGRAQAAAHQLRGDLAALLWKRPLVAADLFDTGSPGWAAWYTPHREAGDRLLRLLGVEAGRATDGWVAQAAARVRSNVPTATEFGAAVKTFDALHAATQLVDDIQSLERRARTVRAIEAELSLSGAELRRTLVWVHGLTAAGDFRRYPVLRDALGRALARVASQAHDLRRWSQWAHQLHRLGVALEDAESQLRSYEWTRNGLLEAARDRDLTQWEPRAISLALRDRLRRLPTHAAEAEEGEQLRELIRNADALAVVDDTSHRLNSDLYFLLSRVDSELAGHAAPGLSIAEAPSSGRLAAELVPARDALVARRRELLAVLHAADSRFGVDPTRLDSGRAGANELTRLRELRERTAAEPGGTAQIGRLDQIVRRARLLVRTTERISRIDTVAAALDEADQQILAVDGRLDGLRADYLRRFPLDRRLFPDEFGENRLALHDAVHSAEASVRAQDREEARDGAESVRNHAVAQRSRSLRRISELNDHRGRWVAYRNSLRADAEPLLELVRRMQDAEFGIVDAFDELGRLADRTGVELDRLGPPEEWPAALRSLLGAELGRIVAALGDKASINLHGMAGAPAGELDPYEVGVAVRRALLQLGDRVSSEQTELLARCADLTEMAAEADVLQQWPDELRDAETEFGIRTAKTQPTPPFAETTAHDGTVPYSRTDAHAANRCASLTAETHRIQTGRTDVVVLEPEGLPGSSLRTYTAAVHGIVQRFAVDPIIPHGELERAARELIESMPPDERDGFSIIVVDGTHEVDEHGVSAHTYRLEYRHDEHTGIGWFELQDPGKGEFGEWLDVIRSSELTGIWVMAFDRNGIALRLPGGAGDDIPPWELRIGSEESRPVDPPRARFDDFDMPLPVRDRATKFRMFGEWLRAVRQVHGYTQSRLADAMGFSRNTVIRAESGRTITVEYLRRFGRALGLSDTVIRGAGPQELLRDFRDGPEPSDHAVAAPGTAPPETKSAADPSRHIDDEVPGVTIDWLRSEPAATPFVERVGRDARDVFDRYPGAEQKAQMLDEALNPPWPRFGSKAGSEATLPDALGQVFRSIVRAVPSEHVPAVVRAFRLTPAAEAQLLHAWRELRGTPEAGREEELLALWRQDDLPDDEIEYRLDLPVLTYFRTHDRATLFAITVLDKALHGPWDTLRNRLRADSLRTLARGVTELARSVPAEHYPVLLTAFDVSAGAATALLDALRRAGGDRVDTWAPTAARLVTAILGAESPALRNVDVHRQRFGEEATVQLARFGKHNPYLVYRSDHIELHRPGQPTLRGSLNGPLVEALTAAYHAEPSITFLNEVRDKSVPRDPVIIHSLPTEDWGTLRLHVYESRNLGEGAVVAAVVGAPEQLLSRPPLVRLHSRCLYGDVLHSTKCDCYRQLLGALDQMYDEGAGVVIYMDEGRYGSGHEGRGVGLLNKAAAYREEDKGFNTAQAFDKLHLPYDLRRYGHAAYLLRYLGVEAVRMMTNNPEKIAGLEKHGIELVRRVPQLYLGENRTEYLDTKRLVFGHLLDEKDFAEPQTAASQPTPWSSQPTDPAVPDTVTTTVPPVAETTGSDGTAPYVPTDAHAANRCATRTAEAHREDTGRSDVVVPVTEGLGGVFLRTYAEGLHGDPQRFAIDALTPHFNVEKSARAAIAALPPEERDGVSLVVVDVTLEVDEHGVGAHTYRLKYRYDEQTNTGWFVLQDPGKGQFGVWRDAMRSPELTGIWVMAFDRKGVRLHLSGAEDDTPPAELRIGSEESDPVQPSPGTESQPGDSASSGPGSLADEANIRSAVARRVDERAARLRRELVELLRPHDIEAGDLLRPGSSAWDSWSTEHRRLRGEVIDMVGIERGRAVDDAWLRHMLTEWREPDHATPEFDTVAKAFADSYAVVKLVDDIRGLDRWARTVDAVEAALARHLDQARRLLAAPLARLRGIVGAVAVFRPLGALVPVIDSLLTTVIEGLTAAERLKRQADALYALGTAIEDYQRVLGSRESSHRQILAAARQYGLPAWDTRSGFALLLARLRHLSGAARTSGDEDRAENLHRLVQRATMAVQLYDTIQLLNTDMAAVIEHATAPPADDPAAADETPDRVRELSGPTPLREYLAVLRDDVARQRRDRFAVLLDGLGDEFAVDIAALDECGWGGHELNRLLSLQATKSDRLAAAIRILRAIARANTLLTRIDTAVVALDDADPRRQMANQARDRVVDGTDPTVPRTADIDQYDSDLDEWLDAVLDAVGTVGESFARPEAAVSVGADRTTTVDLERADIVTLQSAMTDGVVTSVGLVEGYLRRIEISDSVYPPSNAILAVNPNAIAEAERLDAERRQGHVRGPLHGIPILIKDNIDVAGMPTTAGSVALRNSYPARDAFIVQRLRAAGAVILGKTNMTELANFMAEGMPSGWSALGGHGRNPYGPFAELSGSSRADVVAAGLAAAAIGTETSGSVVSPAVNTSVIGLKPVDLVSRTGILPVSGTLDTAGVLARTVRDAAILLTVMAGPDPEDPVTERAADRAGTDYAGGLYRGASAWPADRRGRRAGQFRRRAGGLPSPGRDADPGRGA
ncbi:GTP cyclohydrolase II RibA [Nocardia sp. N2S4-5]|uniref:GTP cyclohydrolase II RibA n=1 Tax=Nocardia sp. N2S4-5 TaxID=3351565 RepID=UPI0037CEFD21